MTENKNYLWIAIIFVISIIGQVVSYVAVDRILARVLESKTQVVVTVSENASALSETQVIGQIPTQKIEVGETPAEEIETEFGAFVEEYKPFGVLNAAAGVNYYGDQKETYYNLPMDVVVMYAKQRIEGMEDAEAWIREDGAKMLGEYIMCAACYDVHPYGSTLQSSMGECIVVDTGGFALTNPNQIDIAVNW